MGYDRKILQKSDPFKRTDTIGRVNRTIYYGEVVSINDPDDGGRIKARIEGLDNDLLNENLPWSHPLMPKFFHIYPKIGEMVRIFIEDIKKPESGRFWMGSIISQPQKIGFDTIYSALSTSERKLTQPEKPINTFPDAKGVFPEKGDVALIGRDNTDVVLKNGQLMIRTGKHEKNNILKLNKKNPATLIQTFETIENEEISSTLMMSDKIVLLSHTGIPKFKAANIDNTERIRMFNDAHPMVRGDILVELLNVVRNSILQHIHGYSGLPADKDSIINDLEKMNFESMLQKNILIN